VNLVRRVTFPTRTDEPVLVRSTPVGDAVVVPVERPAGHPVGIVIADTDGVRYRAVVDIERLARTAVIATGLIGAAVVAATATRRRPMIGVIHMGPGGWVSLKGVAAPPLRPDARRPWWARLLRARRLVVE
jgi:hypothetical protein